MTLEDRVKSLTRTAGRLLPRPVKHRLTKRVEKLRYVPSIRIREAGPVDASPFAACVATPNPLTELGEKYRPTKRYHNYLPYYWQHFRDIREHVRTFVEIGIETDLIRPDVEEFFPNATIYGIDINPICKSYESGRIKIFIGSQDDRRFLDDCMKQIGRSPDVIIDDGSHRPNHQIASFNALFPRLSSHGIYVVEDTGGSVEDAELRTVNRLKTLIDDVFYWPKRDPKAHWTTLDSFPDDAGWLARNVTGIAFYRWIAFVMRGKNPSDNPYLPLTPETIEREHLAPLVRG